MTLEEKLNEYYKDGFELGIEEMRTKEKPRIISTMIENGFDDRMIMSVFKTVTAEDIAVIRRQMTQASQ